MKEHGEDRYGAIAQRLSVWYGEHGRDLPWRHTRDPYRIWVSEIILQQTRVAQAMGYYERFTERFPDAKRLAEASEDEVLKLWQGLGYYSRARHLHAAAALLCDRFGGHLPADYAAVRSMPGVGDYTAAAICSIAFGMPYAVVDGNVFRVLSRLFDCDEPIDTTAGRRFFAELAAALLPVTDPGRHNQAIMDFGALQCLPGRPDCPECPLNDLCLAFASGKVSDRPVRTMHTKIASRWFNYLQVVCDGNTWIHRRQENDIWHGLYEFPMVETSDACDWLRLAGESRVEALFGGVVPQPVKVTEMPPHQLSHRVIRARFFRFELTEVPSGFAKFLCVPVAELGNYAIPRLIERYLENS